VIHGKLLSILNHYQITPKEKFRKDEKCADDPIHLPQILRATQEAALYFLF
jgi:hypothetical protein